MKRSFYHPHQSVRRRLPAPPTEFHAPIAHLAYGTITDTNGRDCVKCTRDGDGEFFLYRSHIRRLIADEGKMIFLKDNGECPHAVRAPRKGDRVVFLPHSRFWLWGYAQTTAEPVVVVERANTQETLPTSLEAPHGQSRLEWFQRREEKRQKMEAARLARTQKAAAFARTFLAMPQ